MNDNLAFTPDGNVVAAAWNASVSLWDTRVVSGPNLRHFTSEIRVAGLGFSGRAVFHPDGADLLWITGSDGMIRNSSWEARVNSVMIGTGQSRL